MRSMHPPPNCGKPAPSGCCRRALPATPHNPPLRIIYSECHLVGVHAFSFASDRMRPHLRGNAKGKTCLNPVFPSIYDATPSRPDPCKGRSIPADRARKMTEFRPPAARLPAGPSRTEPGACGRAEAGGARCRGRRNVGVQAGGRPVVVPRGSAAAESAPAAGTGAPEGMVR